VDKDQPFKSSTSSNSNLDSLRIIRGYQDSFTMSPSDTTYDIIFAGRCVIAWSHAVWWLKCHSLTLGGAVACVTAGRLAAVDPSLRILVRIVYGTQEHNDIKWPWYSRSWKLVHRLEMWRTSYNLHATIEIWCRQRKRSPFTKPKAARHWLAVLSSFLLDGALVVGLASTVRICLVIRHMYLYQAWSFDVYASLRLRLWRLGVCLR
jgi:hypothetical protein